MHKVVLLLLCNIYLDLDLGHGFEMKILEKVGSQTLTNGDYTKQQLNVIIDCIEF